MALTKEEKRFDTRHNPELAEWGFDLTDFSRAKTFEQLLRKNNLISGYKRYKVKRGLAGDKTTYYKYVWRNSSVQLVTNNNPLTGKYTNPSMRDDEKGYASYMSVIGEPAAVRELVQDIRELATYIKGESPRENEFLSAQPWREQ